MRGLREALACHQRGDLDGAITGYRAAIAAGEHADAASYNLGVALSQRGDPAAAEQAFRDCIELDPDFSQARDSLGLLLARTGRLFEAEEHLLHALAVKPSLDTAANLGAVFQQQGRPEACFGTLYPYLKAGAHHPVGWNTLGAALMDKGDLPSAAGCFQRAYRQDPRNPAPLINLHAAVFDDRDPTAARRCLEQAHDVAPDNPQVSFFLGMMWGLIAPEAAEAHHRRLPPEASAWRDSWSFCLANKDARTRFFGATAATLRYTASLASLSGLVVELGVRFGTTLEILHSACGQDVHGFDTFTGLPEAWHGVPAGAYSTGGRQPALGEGRRLHPGLFAESLPPFLAEHEGAARLIHVDCDLYSATVDGLEALVPRIHPGTVIVFDEYLMNPKWREDEHRAFFEVARRHGWQWRYAAFSLFSHQAVVVIEGV